MIIFPRRQRNANNVVTAHLADNPLPFCSFWRLIRLLIQTWDFCKAICSVLQLPCCLKFPLQLHHQDTVSSAAVGQTAVQNVMSYCDLCVHTHCSFTKCCVSQNKVFYIIFMFLRHVRGTHNMIEERKCLCQWVVDFAATWSESKLSPRWEFIKFLAVISIQLRMLGMSYKPLANTWCITYWWWKWPTKLIKHLLN